MKDILLGQDELKSIAARVGKEISDSLKGEDRIPLIVGVLKGSLNFMMDVLAHIDIPIYTDYIQVSSYVGSKSSGTVKLLKDVNYDCEGRSVVIVEDIVDTGLSMQYLIEHFKLHHPKRVLVATLFDKKNARKVKVPLDFVGYVLEQNDFLIGYGLDYNQLQRNLPYVYKATPEDVKELDAILEKDGVD